MIRYGKGKNTVNGTEYLHKQASAI